MIKEIFSIYSFKKSLISFSNLCISSSSISLKDNIDELKEEKQKLQREIYNIEDIQVSADLFNQRENSVQYANKNHPELVQEYFRICDLIDNEYEEHLASINEEQEYDIEEI